MQKSKGIAVTREGTFNLQGGKQNVGSATITTTWNTQVSTSTSTTEGHSTTITRAINESIQVPARHALNFEAILYESSAVIPFKANVVLDGAILANLSGISSARNLLSEIERTFEIEGKIKATGVSEAHIRTKNLGPQSPENCKADVSKDLTSTISFSNPSKNLLSGFLPSAKLSRVSASTAKTVSHDRIEPIAPGPVISAPEGTSCEVLWTNQVYKPAPICGFNDVGIPNQGIYNQENKTCRTYSNGQLINQEARTDETFSGQCWTP